MRTIAVFPGRTRIRPSSHRSAHLRCYCCEAEFERHDNVNIVSPTGYGSRQSYFVCDDCITDDDVLVVQG